MKRFEDGFPGKPIKVDITAVMRKMLVTLNAILRTEQPWAHANHA